MVPDKLKSCQNCLVKYFCDHLIKIEQERIFDKKSYLYVNFLVLQRISSYKTILQTDKMSDTITFQKLGYTNGSPLTLQEKTFNISKDLASDEIIVKINSAALNPVDLILFHTSRYVVFKRGEKGIGRDFSGTVHAVGSAIKDYTKGDEVSGLYTPVYGDQGTVAEYLKLKPADSPMGKIPSTLTLKEAASFPLVFATAVNTLRKFVVPDETSRVLVIGGATSVGHYVIQLLKNQHHAKSIVSINSGSSAELVKSLGADRIVDYATENVAKSATEIVENDFKNEKFDLIIDCVGNNELFPVINMILKPKSEQGGYVTIVGDKIADYNKSMLSFFNTGILTKAIPFFRNFHYGFASTADDFYPLAKKLFEEGKLKTHIDSSYPLAEYQKAFDKLATHKAKGKIIIELE